MVKSFLFMGSLYFYVVRPWEPDHNHLNETGGRSRFALWRTKDREPYHVAGGLQCNSWSSWDESGSGCQVVGLGFFDKAESLG